MSNSVQRGPAPPESPPLTIPQNSPTSNAPPAAPIQAQPGDLARASQITAIVGLILLISGATLTALFFSAPVSVPLLIASTGVCAFVSIAAAASGKAGQGASGCIACIFMFGALIAGAIGAYKIGTHNWSSIKNFVYRSDVAKIAGIAGSTIFGSGLILLCYAKYKNQ